jgi:hypothetical protein
MLPYNLSLKQTQTTAIDRIFETNTTNLELILIFQVQNNSLKFLPLNLTLNICLKTYT